jgi:hypothetical protein
VLETGSKGPAIADIVIVGNYFFATKTGGPYRGLMYRPVQDSNLANNKFFDLEHWDAVINQGSSNFGSGQTSNFKISGNQHAQTHNTKPYAINAGGQPVIDKASERYFTGAEAANMATIWRKEAFAKRDIIIAKAGPSGVTPTPPPVPDPVPTPTPTPDPNVNDAQYNELKAEIDGLKAVIADTRTRPLGAGVNLTLYESLVNAMAAGRSKSSLLELRKVFNQHRS